MSHWKGREDRIVTLLETMNDAIRSARFAECAAISAELETIFMEMPDLESARLPRIRQLALRNAACLDAAAQGVRAGRRRLAEITAADRADTYDQHGARQAMPIPSIGRRL